MAYEKPVITDFGSIADHTYSEVLACFCGGSPDPRMACRIEDV